MTVNGKVHLVLNRGIKSLGGKSRPIIVQSGGIEVGDLLIELAFTGSDLSNPFQLFIKIFIGQQSASFEPLVIHDPAFDRVSKRNGVDPLAELNRPFGIDFETDSNDHLQVVVICVVVFPIGFSYSKISNN